MVVVVVVVALPQAMAKALIKYNADRSAVLSWCARNEAPTLRSCAGICRLFAGLRLMDRAQAQDARSLCEWFGRTLCEAT